MTSEEKQSEEFKDARERRITAHAARVSLQENAKHTLFAPVDPDDKLAYKADCRRCGKSFIGRKTGSCPAKRRSYCSRDCQYQAGVEIRLKGRK